MSELSDVGRTYLLLLLIMSLGTCLVWAFWEFEQARDRWRRRANRWIPLVGFIAPLGLWLMPLTAMGRDLDGRYANSPLKPWFEQLKSRNGTCCSDADGYVVEDADWEARTVTIACACQSTPTPKSWFGSMYQTIPSSLSIIRPGGPWSGRHILALQRRRTSAITYGSAASCQGA